MNRIHPNHTAARPRSFAHPTAYKALRGAFLEVYPQRVLVAETESGLRRYALAATIGLAQAGEAAVLKSLLAVLASTDQHDIRKMLEGIGGETERLCDDRQTGNAELRVGKGGFTVAQARQTTSEIRRRFELWTEAATRRFAIHAVLDMEAGIKPAP